MKQIGPYRLLRRLGAGGMGEVWMAERSGLGGVSKLVALKLLAPHRIEDAHFRRMFIDEARLSTQLNSSNIVQVFDVGEDAGSCYMAMEWVDGLNLDQLNAHLRAANEQLSFELAAYIFGEVLKALIYAHDYVFAGERRTVVHRDVSPQNVMISVTGEVKLMDFGIARMSTEETSGLFVKGKLRYMAPEQLQGDRRPTIDLFAAGAILHELLDGRKFRHTARANDAHLMGMSLRGEFEPLGREQVPAELEALRAKLLAVKVEDRLPSAREAYRQLTCWPGYRDLRFDLEELVRRFVADDAARTGVVATEVLTAPRVESPTPSSGSNSEPANIGQLDSGTSPNDRPEGVAAPVVPTKARLLALGLVLAGAGLGIFGIGAWLGWWSDDDQEPTRADLEAADVAITEPASRDNPPSVQPESPRTSTSEPKPPVIETQVPELEPQPPQKRDIKAQPALVPIRLTASGHKFWVEIELAGKNYVIQRGKRSSIDLRLEPGRYPLKYRTNENGLLESGDDVVIPSKGPIVVDLQKDGTVVVK